MILYFNWKEENKFNYLLKNKSWKKYNFSKLKWKKISNIKSLFNEKKVNYYLHGFWIERILFLLFFFSIVIYCNCIIKPGPVEGGVDTCNPWTTLGLQCSIEGLLAKLRGICLIGNHYICVYHPHTIPGTFANMQTPRDSKPTILHINTHIYDIHK